MKLDGDYYNKIVSLSGAVELLENFTDHKLAAYKSKRNYDYGSYEKNFVSALSPALSRRIITEEEIIKHVSSQFSFGKIEKFVDEKSPAKTKPVPDRFAPCDPSEKTVVLLNWALPRFEFIRFTPLRFTPRKSTPCPNPPPTVEKSIPLKSALVPVRFAPCTPSEKIVSALN
nr:hypothetical protein [Alteromonas macleodii]